MATNSEPSFTFLDSRRNFIRTLVEARPGTPGTYHVEWDGTLQQGTPVGYDLPYVIKIVYDHQTHYVKTVAKAVC